MKHKLIIIEGGDGTGKSSIATELAKRIKGVYYKTPSKLFWQIRQEIEKTKNYDLIFYFYLTGTLHASTQIENLLEETHVICDRYFFTTIVIHECLGVTIPDNLSSLFIKPDYAFCLYANEEVIKERLRKRLTLGPHDLNFKLQRCAFKKMQKFGLELFDTSYSTVEESTQSILKKIKF